MRKTPSTVELRELIHGLLKKKSLSEPCFKKMVSYVIELFTTKGLGDDYYGYHNINHELSVTYVTLLALSGKNFENIISPLGLKYLFASALLHDLDPAKNVDKPHEEAVLKFIKSDHKILALLKEAGLDFNIVAILILRTTYPLVGNSKKRVQKEIDIYFSRSTFVKDKFYYKEYFIKLGSFLSITDRIGSYALSDFQGAMDIVKKNAHALGWDPGTMIRRSVGYFEDLLNNEKEMTDAVLGSIPIPLRKIFMNNVINFFKMREREIQVRASIVFDKLQLVPRLEEGVDRTSDNFINSLFDIFEELPDPLQFKRKNFAVSVKDPKTILITLRVGDENGDIIGFAKGAPLETYSLPPKINDENHGKLNTIFLEPLALKIGYWGQGGGPKMRGVFRAVAKKRGYKYVSSLQSREVIQNRINRGEKVEFVQKRDPEKLDYYRVTL